MSGLRDQKQKRTAILLFVEWQLLWYRCCYKNLKGWSEGDGSYSPLPDPLDENKITAAYSDSKILFGLIKPNGEVKIKVNEKYADMIDLSTLSEDVLKLYKVEGYYIWFIERSKLEENNHFNIKVLDDDGNILSDLTI